MMMRVHDFAALIDLHGAGLVLFARQWCATPEDVVQEAMLKLMVLRAPPKDVAAWLYRVVRNAAIDAGRKERCRRRHERAAGRAEGRWFYEPNVEGLNANEAVTAIQNF